VIPALYPPATTAPPGDSFSCSTVKRLFAPVFGKSILIVELDPSIPPKNSQAVLLKASSMKDDNAFCVNYQKRLALTIKLQDLIGQRSSLFICGPDCLHALTQTMDYDVVREGLLFFPVLMRYAKTGPHTSWVLMSGMFVFLYLLFE
jgi:hypothetical protein